MLPDTVASQGVCADIAELAELSDDFFDGPSEIAEYIAADGLTVYRRRAGALIGAGVRHRVVEAIDGVDIGMVVAPAFRGRGYGAEIVRDLKARCHDLKQRPICGCDIDNIASQRTLERAGFVSRHNLLEFTLSL